MEYRWNIYAETDEERQADELLSKDLHISLPSARLLVRRGIRSAEEAKTYIRPSLERLNDPYLMRDMDKAVERLNKALLTGERILVYGDFDVDGTTAVALMYTFLSSLTTQLDFYVPDRFTEGYGISFRGIDYAQQQGCTLIVALDCGIKEVDKVEYAKARQIDFIICDHHTPGDTLPTAVAVLNMKRSDCPYPYKELSGCGVGFKLVQALARYRGLPDERWHGLLSLTAMAIASDVVPVTGENRILAYYGLKQLNACPSVGLQSLLKVADINIGKVTMNDLMFKIGPRINASGHMKSGMEAVKLLITGDRKEAEILASDINTYNTERRNRETHITDEALALLKQDPDNERKHTTVVFSPDWYKGVIGITASRLTDFYYRPTIVLTGGEGNIVTGSARSVNGFDIYSAIDSCRDLLTSFGGHQFAAGLNMRRENLPAFKERFEQYVGEHIQQEQLVPIIPIEQELRFADIDDRFFNILRHLEPFGPGNPRPVFCTHRVINNRYTKRVGKTGEHLRLDITDRTAAIQGIAFGQGDKALHLQNGLPADVCYELEENTYNGVTSVQMVVHDIKLMN